MYVNDDVTDVMFIACRGGETLRNFGLCGISFPHRCNSPVCSKHTTNSVK